METSLMVYDYPSPPEEKTKTIKGKVYLEYKFEMEVPSNWEDIDIIQDIHENISEYQQDLVEITDIDIQEEYNEYQ